jgi:hypothetical protein
MADSFEHGNESSSGRCVIPTNHLDPVRGVRGATPPLLLTSSSDSA